MPDDSQLPEETPPAPVFVPEDTRSVPLPPFNETPEPPQRRRGRQMLVLVGCVEVLILALGLGVLMVAPPWQGARTVIIPKGASVQDVGTALSRADMIWTPWAFRGAARVLAGDVLQAGEYTLGPGASTVDIVLILREGRTVPRKVTVAEGLTSWEIAQLLEGTPAMTGEVRPVPPEGALLPETYRFSYGDSRSSLIERMRKEQGAVLAKIWEGRNRELPLKTPADLVILASLVEKETGQKAEERARVAGVFVNRLRLGMPLQSDPTVIYALTRGKDQLGRSLTHDDLDHPSPYNTYRVTGLPPGPICNPGRAALEAAAHPEKSTYLYFVSDGMGGHAFAETLDVHNRNVAKWLSLSRPLAGGR